jgi:hypothetical protein
MVCSKVLPERGILLWKKIFSIILFFLIGFKSNYALLYIFNFLETLKILFAILNSLTPIFLAMSLYPNPKYRLSELPKPKGQGLLKQDTT